MGFKFSLAIVHGHPIHVYQIPSLGIIHARVAMYLSSVHAYMRACIRAGLPARAVRLNSYVHAYIYVTRVYILHDHESNVRTSTCAMVSRFLGCKNPKKIARCARLS